MEDIYNNQIYLKNNPTWHSEDSLFKAKKIANLIRKNSVEIKNICEIGCGSGEILVQLSYLLEDVDSFYGTEISNDAIKIAKNKETSKIRFELLDLAQSNNNEYFDMILVIDVIEHLENYFKFLKNISKKSNYTIFHIPLDMCVWTLFREKMLIESKNRVGHIHNYTENFILNVLDDYGYEVIDKVYTEPIYAVKTFKQKIIKYLRKFLFFINPTLGVKFIGGYSIMVLTKSIRK